MTAKGYWIAQAIVHDTDAYDKYRAANAPSLAQYGGKFLVRGGTQDVQEGTWRPRTVVIEFPSYEAALACYHSAAYAEAIAAREGASVGDLVIVEGFA